MDELSQEVLDALKTHLTTPPCGNWWDFIDWLHDLANSQEMEESGANPEDLTALSHGLSQLHIRLGRTQL